jgi:hypothetical protein
VTILSNRYPTNYHLLLFFPVQLTVEDLAYAMPRYKPVPYGRNVVQSLIKVLTDEKSGGFIWQKNFILFIIYLFDTRAAVLRIRIRDPESGAF